MAITPTRPPLPAHSAADDGKALTVQADNSLAWETPGGGHDPVTVADTGSIDLTLTGQQVSAAAVFGTSAGTVSEGDHAHAATYQPLDAQLTDVAGLTPTDNGVIIGNGSNFVVESGATLKTSLGLTIGTDVQAFDAGLADVAGLAVTDGNIIVGNGANWVAESGATARASLGLTIGTNVQAFDADLAAIAALVDPNADRILFWDDSAGAYTYLTPSTGLTLSGTTLTAPRLPLVITFNASVFQIWTNMPAALTDFLGAGQMTRTKVDLTNATQVRMTAGVQTAGAAGAKLRAQYSTDESAWDYLDGVSEPSVGIGSTGLVVSDWTNIAAGAKADVFLKLVGLDGDAAADPSLRIITVQFR